MAEAKEMAKHGCLEQLLLTLYFQKEILYLFLLQSFFSTPSFFIITPYSLSFLDPTVFPSALLFFFSLPYSNLFTFPRGDEDIPVGVDRNLGMVCVCACVFVFKCVSMLYDALISRWEGGSLLCNLLRPTILPHLCVSLRRFALSHTRLPSLSHLTVSLVRSPCTSSSTSTYLPFFW